MTASMIRTAVITKCGHYRYRLTRQWGTSPPLTFVMLNPSTADAEVDDPTIRRCIAFARRGLAGGIVVVNLYAYRATNPAALWEQEDPYGPENDLHLEHAARQAAASGLPVVCAWGVHGGRNNRPIVLMQRTGARLVCLGRTKDGHPRHPLYVKGDTPLESYP